MQKDHFYKVIGIFVLAFCLFNFPMIGLLSEKRLILGLPALFVYIFGCWLLIVFLVFRMSEKENK